jgi:hypothetical protein
MNVNFSRVVLGYDAHYALDAVRRSGKEDRIKKG